MKSLLTIFFVLFYNTNLFSQSNDCPAFCVSTTVSFTWTPIGIGTQELNVSNQGCMTLEHQSVWLSVTILTSGNLVFRINPNAADDFDFAVWQTASCPPTISPVRCSWAAGIGNTGLRSAALDFSEGAGGDDWVAPLSVTAGQTYKILIDNFSINSGFTLDWSFGANVTTATFTCTVLPIELLSFVGECKGEYNLIEWSTASESNNDYFSIQRSLNGYDWLEIGKVQGSGNSSQVLNYSFHDDNPNNGTNYYRLKQVDFDGKYEYSDIIFINNDNKSIKSITIYDMIGNVCNPNNTLNGIYIYHIQYDDNTIEIKKIIK